MPFGHQIALGQPNSSASRWATCFKARLSESSRILTEYAALDDSVKCCYLVNSRSFRPRFFSAFFVPSSVDPSGLGALVACERGLQFGGTKEAGVEAYLGIFLVAESAREEEILRKATVFIRQRTTYKVKRCKTAKKVTNEWTGDREEWFLLHTGTRYVQPLLLKQYMFDPPRKRTRRSDQEKTPEPTRCTKGRMLLEWEIRVFFPDRNNPGLTDREFQMGKEPAGAGYGPNTWQTFHSAWWSTGVPQAWKHEPDFTDTISVELKWDMCGTRMKFDVQGSTGTLGSLARPMDGRSHTEDAVMHRKEYKPSPTASLWIPQNGRWCLKERP